jgi:hypothetical protein
MGPCLQNSTPKDISFVALCLLNSVQCGHVVARVGLLTEVGPPVLVEWAFALAVPAHFLR